MGQLLDNVISWIEKAETASSECIPFMGVDLRMDEVRSEPRFQGVMERVEHPLFGKPLPWLEDEKKEKENEKRRTPDVALGETGFDETAAIAAAAHN